MRFFRSLRQRSTPWIAPRLLYRSRSTLTQRYTAEIFACERKVTLTVPEAAELIGICKPTMYEMVRAGKVRSVKIGKKILISRQSLMDWLKEGDSYEEAC